jgi:peptidoglycan glycosyltransferase
VIGYWSKKYGTYGIEKTLNSVLVHSASKKGEKKGADVTLTLDKGLQEKAYEEIKDFTGSVVVMNAKTGELLALASSPTFSLQSLEEDWEEINQQEGVFLSNAFQNPVVPGSVFKLITSKGIIENKLEKKTVEDNGSLKVNGQTIKNYNGTAHGTISFEDGFVKSSNVYFMTMGLEMGGQTLKECAESFLLGEDISLDFTTLHSTFDLDNCEDNIVASTAFGQGSTLVTPLQMAMVTQSVADGGEMLKPYLIQSVINGKGKVLEEGKSETLSETMSASTAKKIRNVMIKAGESYGLTTVGEDEWKIGAKTGTGQRGDGTNNAWLVTFAPADDPQYVIVVNRLKTKEIGKTLAPIAEDLYEYLCDHR